MNFNKHLAILALSTLSSLFFNIENAVATNGWQPETLRGISQLKVKVNKDNCSGGTKVANLKSAIESYLIKNGVPVTRNTKINTNAYIYTETVCYRKNNTYVFMVSLEMIQYVKLNGKRIKASTYMIPHTLGRSDTYNFSRQEQKFYLQGLKEFISDWRSVR